LLRSTPTLSTEPAEIHLVITKLAETKRVTRPSPLSPSLLRPSPWLLPSAAAACPPLPLPSWEMELSWELYQTALLRLWSSEERELERAGVGWELCQASPLVFLVLVTASLGENSYFLLNKHHSLTKSIFKSVSTIVFLTMISTK
jgi:hypothetical protein